MSGTGEAADIAGNSAGTSTPANDGLPIYATVAAATNAFVPSRFTVLRTIGYASESDGGGAYYARGSAAPIHNLWFQDKSGSYWALNPTDGIWNARQCGALGDGQTDDTSALQNALQFAQVYNASNVSPPTRRPKLLIPAGTYLHTGLIIQDTQPGMTSCNAGFIDIEGDGPANTALACTEAAFSSIAIFSGVVSIRSLHITSVGTNRSKTVGGATGHGIFALPCGTPLTDMTRVVLEDLTIDQQPGDGMNLCQIEQFEINRVFSCNNGGNGLTESVLPKGAPGITVGCQIRSCRFAENGNAGIDVDLHNSTLINVETLNNEGSIQFHVRGFRNVIVNPDVEQATGTGLVLGGDLNTVIGGIFNRISNTAIQVYGNAATIINPGIVPSPTGLGIDLGAGTTGHHIRVCLPDDDTAGPMFSSPNPDPGSTYSYVTSDGTGYLLQGTFRSYPGIGNTVTPVANGELSFEATANDTVTIHLQGSDGVTRSTSLTLS